MSVSLIGLLSLHLQTIKSLKTFITCSFFVIAYCNNFKIYLDLILFWRYGPWLRYERQAAGGRSDAALACIRTHLEEREWESDGGG